MTAMRKQKNTDAPIGERLLTLREAAEALRLNPRTVWEYVRRGELQGRIIGRRAADGRLVPVVFLLEPPCRLQGQ
jgi:hypothetical protein